MTQSTSYSATAEYLHLEAALKSFWIPFNELTNEMERFKPRSLSDFDEERHKLLDHYGKLNPTMSHESLAQFVETQINGLYSDDMQFHDLFSARFMTMYVTVSFLSHALCEAAINAILAMGLFEHGSTELFSVIERADIKDKWRVGPKSFFSAYEFHPGTALFETLSHLTKQRNALVHNKIHLSVGDKKIIQGSAFERLSVEENVRWMKRFFSLPYDLTKHVNTQLKRPSYVLLWDRSPIEIAEAHKTFNNSSGKP